MASQKEQAEPISTSEAELTQLLQHYFSSAEDVVAIFLTNHPSQYWVLIITNHQTYSHEAMDALFEREFELRDQLQGKPVEIDYIPQLGQALDEVRPANASIVLRRD
jgi:hypothetical protein